MYRFCFAILGLAVAVGLHGTASADSTDLPGTRLRLAQACGTGILGADAGGNAQVVAPSAAQAWAWQVGGTADKVTLQVPGGTRHLLGIDSWRLEQASDGAVRLVPSHAPGLALQADGAGTATLAPRAATCHQNWIPQWADVPDVRASRGRIWYVATDGSDANPGTRTQPLASLVRAAQLVQPGQTIIVRTGTYVADTPARFTGKRGTATRPILVRGEGMPVLRSPSLDTAPGVWTGIVMIEDSSFITVSGLRVENSNAFGFKIDRSDDITIQGNQSHVTLASGIYFNTGRRARILANDVSRFCDRNAYGGPQGCQEGISLSTIDGFEIADNLVHDAPQQPDVMPGGGEGIDVKVGTSNGSIHHNDVYRLVQLGIYVDAWDTTASNIEIYGNRVRNTYMGIAVNSEQGGLVDGVRIHSNVIWDNGYDGVTIGAAGNNGPRRNIAVYNNTIVRNGYTPNKPPFCVIWGCGNFGSGIRIDTQNLLDPVRVHDNIIVDNATSTIDVAPEIRARTLVDNNLVLPVGAVSWSYEYNGNRPIVVSPMFVDPAAADFRLRPGSPAIARSVGTDPLGLDPDKRARPPGRPADLGAYAGN